VVDRLVDGVDEPELVRLEVAEGGRLVSQVNLCAVAVEGLGDAAVEVVDLEGGGVEEPPLAGAWVGWGSPMSRTSSWVGQYCSRSRSYQTVTAIPSSVTAVGSGHPQPSGRLPYRRLVGGGRRAVMAVGRGCGGAG
jgi:hypothetical protein